MKHPREVNRAKLVDEPIVEMILANKYFDSGITFMKADLQSDYDGADIVCYSNGSKKFINVKRNSSKYFNSPNFTFTINKHKLAPYDITSYVFIDESADCLYIVNGEDIFKYIIAHKDNLRDSSKNKNTYYLILPKKDIIDIIGDNKDVNIIKYSKAIADLLAEGRDESKYTDLI